MKFHNKYMYSFIAPFMVLLSILGFIFREDRKKNFYLPLGVTGIYLIVEKEFNRRANRKSLLNKFKLFAKK